MRKFAGVVALLVAGMLSGALLLPRSEPAYASTCSVPYTFSAGTTIYSSQVNSNFSALVSCANFTSINITGTINTSGLYQQGGSTVLSTIWGSSENTAVGISALNATTTSGGNTAVGFETLTADTSGYYNVAVGPLALYRNTTGFNNTAIGPQALQLNTVGNLNVAIGATADDATISSNYDTVVGASAFFYHVSGDYNTVLGYGAGYYPGPFTGSHNLYVGDIATASGGSVTNEMVIAPNNTTGNGSNTYTIGNSTQTGYLNGSAVQVNSANGLDVNKINYNSGFFNSVGIYDSGSTNSITIMPSGTRASIVSSIGPGLYVGTGVPSFSAANSSLFMRYDGGSNTRLYVNTSGASSSGTTWTAIND